MAINDPEAKALLTEILQMLLLIASDLVDIEDKIFIEQVESRVSEGIATEEDFEAVKRVLDSKKYQ